jgi:transcription elongation factor GreB
MMRHAPSVTHDGHGNVPAAAPGRGKPRASASPPLRRVNQDLPMSRYRPPANASSRYITPEGARRMREELEQLWRTERPRVTQAVAEAAAQGDRSENAEYIYGKRRLREIDRRVRHLRKRLEGMVVVEHAPADPRRVYFGAWVTLESGDGATSRYRIVGPDEFDREPGYISMDSPLGRALLRRALEEEVTLELPGGSRAYVIVKIEYAATTSPARS